MRWLKNKGICFLVLAFMVMLNGLTVSAAEEEYTYTVRLYAGNQGRLLGGGVDVSSESAGVSFTDGYLVIEGLKYGDTVYIRPQAAAEVTDERYYVRGVRRSGRDNSEAEAPTFRVASDRDYVMAYGIRGNMAAYTVHYVDGDGRTLMESDTYYGNIGERQYVSSRYIDGYQPQAYNMTGVLDRDASKNVFSFVYTPITAGTQQPGTQPTTAPTQIPAPQGTTAPAPGITSDTTGDETGEDVGDEGGGDAADDAAAGEDAGETAGEEGNGPEELEQIGDEEVPLADMGSDSGLAGLTDDFATRIGDLPFAAKIGICSAVLLALGVAGYFLLGRRKKAEIE